jgi:hypothetical protein
MTDTSSLGAAVALNQGLAQWAFALSKDTPLPDPRLWPPRGRAGRASRRPSAHPSC